MIEIDVCVPIIAAILGIGYPILLQVVINLEEKYNSNLIVELFKSEPENKILTATLLFALSSAILVLLNRPPWFDLGVLNVITENSAVLFLIFFTIVLVITFFFFLNKVLVYNSKNKFIIYLIKKHSTPETNRNHITRISTQLANYLIKAKRFLRLDKQAIKVSGINSLLNKSSKTVRKKPKKSDPQEVLFRAISELLYNSIKKQDKESSQTISRFIYDAFLKQRELSLNKPVEYPSEYYELTYKTTEELVLISDNRLLFLESRSVGAIWLLGEMKDFEISELTYLRLWSNLILPVTYKKDNMIISFWETANQYFTYNLRRIDFEYKGGQITNNDLVTKRNQARIRFLEFTYALGALLLYKKRYKCIARMFNFTNSIPPKSELLPSSMEDIINLYIKFRDPYDINYPWIFSKYYFPEIEGLIADYVVKNWICTYLAVLLIRQYSIVPYLITMTPLQFPPIPATQRERKVWLDNLDHLAKLVEDVLQDHELLDVLDYKFLTREWCQQNNKTYPSDFVKQLKTNVNIEYEKHEVEQDISSSKVDNFYSSTQKLLPTVFNLYNNINNPKKIEDQYNQLFIPGERAVIDKSSFSEDQYSEHINYDTFLAEGTANKIQRGVSEIFFNMKTKTYLINPNDIFTAIDKLDCNLTDYIIVGFGNYLEYYINDLKVPGLTSTKYKNLDLINFSQCNFQLLGESFFILNKSDLPNIENMEIDKDEIEKYSLVKIDKGLNIYASVLDFFKRKDLQEEYQKSSIDRDLNKSILLNIIFSTRIRWSKNIKVVQIRSFSKHRENGLPNDLKDIIPMM